MSLLALLQGCQAGIPRQTQTEIADNKIRKIEKYQQFYKRVDVVE